MDWKPGQIFFNTGHFFEAQEQYILQSVSTSALPEDLLHYTTTEFHKKFPHAYPYEKALFVHKDPAQTRKVYADLCSIKAMGDQSKNQRLVINMFSQLFYGHSSDYLDAPDRKLKYFNSALKFVYEMPNVNSIAMKEHIGCTSLDMAEKFWPKYLETITKLAQKSPQIKTVIYVKQLMNAINK